MSGIVGRMFREFALTLTIAVVVSAVISLTLTPMMAARILRQPRHARRGPMAVADRAMERVIEAYRRSLVWVVDRVALMLGVTVVTLAATIALYIVIPKAFCRRRIAGSSPPSSRRSRRPRSMPCARRRR